MKAVARFAIAAVITVTASASAWAQSPAPAPPEGSATVIPELSAIPAHIPVGSRVGELPSGYDDGGRRDPFMSLVLSRRATGQARQGPAPTGLAAMSINDIVVSGITSGGNVKVAVVEGPNRQSFSIQVKSRLLDAVVTRIDSDAVVFTQQDETGMPATQVRKVLRSSGGEVR